MLRGIVSRENSKKKRGQITIFFIVGIVLLLILSVVLFIRSRSIEIDNAVVVPPELLPAKNYIDYCVDTASRDALFFMGRQGGFINIPIEIQSNPARRLSFGNGLELVPYWYYDNAVWVPTFDHMEAAITEDVNKRFLECIHSMDFEYNGFVLETFDDNSTTIVSINDKDISIEIRYPMRISTADMQIGTKLNRFYNVYDIKLKDMVGLGRDILDYENAFYFLENITIGLMSINDDVPFTGMLIECGTDTWYIDDIKKEIQLMLLDTFSEIRVGSTDHFPFEADASIYADYEDYGIAMREAMDEVTLVDNFDEPDDYENALMAAMGSEGLPDAPLPPDAYYYFHYFMDLDEPADNEYQNFSVDFLYFPEFGMDIQAEPSSDGILKSNDIEGFRKYLSFFCINQYHFVYDINYPVIVNMHDPDALKGQGFTFRYAFPVLIRNNEGLRSRQYMDYAKSNSGFDNYCLDDNGRKVLIRVYDQSCGSGCLTPVADVNITMLCANKKCPLGVTDDSTGVALLRTNLTSSCANPYLVAEKEGYLPGYYLLETDTEERINLDMIELKNFSVELKSHKLDTVFNTMGSAESVTGGMANVYVSTVIDDIPYDDSFIIFADQESIIQIPVVSAEYDLSVTYLKNDIDFSGGYYSSWNVTRAELADGNEITFHFIEMLPSTLEEDAVEAIGLINNMTRSGLDPEIN